VVCLLTSTPALPAEQGAALPDDWHGTWAGKLTVHTGSAKPFERTVELHIAPIKGSKTLTWRMVSSFKDKLTTRNYELVPNPKQPGLFQIDEKNGILLDARLMGNTLYCYFKDNDQLTNVKYERRGDSLFIEMASVSLKDPLVSDLRREGIRIESYQLRSVQVGELRRKK
jgi:hypothetical protein